MVRTVSKWTLLWVVAGVLRLDAQVVINEIMFDPLGSEFTDEFVELLNTGYDAVDLTGWRVGDGEEADLLVGIGRGTTLGPGAFALVMDSGYFDSEGSYDPLPEGALVLTVQDATLGSGGLSNSIPEAVALINANGDTVSLVSYTIGNAPGRSEERVLAGAGDGAMNWAESRWDGGTPGRVNSVSPKTYDLAVAVGDSVVSMRDGVERSVDVDVTNLGAAAVDRFVIRLTIDNEEAGVAEGGDLEADDGQRIRLPVSTLRVGIHRANVTVLFAHDEDPTNDTAVLVIRASAPPASVSLSEVMAVPDAGAPEWVEVLNRLPVALDIEGWGIRDRSGAVGVLAASVIVPAGAYAVVTQDADAFQVWYPGYEGPLGEPYRWPTLNNSGDALFLEDPTGIGLDSMEFADAVRGRSLERIRFDASGGDADNWLSSTDPSGGTPGAVNSVHFDSAATGLEFEVSPAPKGPGATIVYTVPWTRAHANVSLFDSQGNRVRWLLRGSEGGSRREVVWDGLGEGGRRLVAGIYILLLEARNGEGETVKLRRPVVIRRGLR